MNSILLQSTLDPKKIDKIVCSSFNNKSYYGYTSSVLKSGICKYYRREIFDKFEWCIIEMAIFKLKKKGLMTNVINRLKILLMEEVIFTNFADLHLYIIIRKNRYCRI